MYTLCLIFLPILFGILVFNLKEIKAIKVIVLISSILTLIFNITALFQHNTSLITQNLTWLPSIGATFSISLDGLSKILTLLSSIVFPIVFLCSEDDKYKNPNTFFGLMLLMQAGLNGVFVSQDCLLFYVFWELVLIPAYFLSSIWGGEKRIAITFKFFVYTFLGSLLMLLGIMFLYFSSPIHSFSMDHFYNLNLTCNQQLIGFWLFVFAFAIKVPIFPFHTWQPDVYENAPLPTTMILSTLMSKMGLYGIIRWILPIFPLAVNNSGPFFIILSIIGIVYASLIAMKQSNLKRIIAYSSIAHLGLMSAVLFSNQTNGIDGVVLQMFNHGIVVLGLWILVLHIEKYAGTTNLNDLGGLAIKAPTLAIFAVLIGFSNIALPLTSSFIGEFLMFNALFNYSFWLATIAMLSIIFGAVYTLNMIKNTFFGFTKNDILNFTDIKFPIQLGLAIVTSFILFFGFYPQPLINITKDFSGVF